MAYEMRITNRWHFGYSTYKRDSLHELHNLLDNLIIDTHSDIKIYEVKEITPSWIKDATRYNSKIHNLTTAQEKTLWHSLTLSKKDVKVVTT